VNPLEWSYINSREMTTDRIHIKEYISDPVTKYNYIEDAKVSVSIKKLMPTNAH